MPTVVLLMLQFLPCIVDFRFNFFKYLLISPIGVTEWPTYISIYSLCSIKDSISISIALRSFKEIASSLL